MNFEPTDVQRDVYQAALRLAQTFSLDYWLDKDNKGEYPWDFVHAFAQGGFLGALIPKEYGGSGLGITEAGLILHAICVSGAGTSGASAAHFYMFPAAPIVRHGSEELKRRVLPKIATAEILPAFGVTEPTAGTDTSRIRTRAERTPGGWVINGQKVWTTNAQNANKILLLARTAPRSDEKPLDGMTLFFPNLDRKACTIRRIEKLGRSAVDSNEVFINNLEVADEDVVGEVGRGFQHLIAGLNPERIVVAMEAIGIGKAALALATKYAKERVVFDRPIGKNQSVAHPLARAWAELEAAWLLALKAAWLHDNDQPCGNESNAAKFIAAEAAFNACDAALQTHGGFGYAKEYHVERLWREVRLFKLAPISQQMVLNHISQHVLGLPKSY